jgi:hypothetical protein
MSVAIVVLILMLALTILAQEQVSHGSLDQTVKMLSVSALSNDGKQVVKTKLKLKLFVCVCVCKKINEQVDV